MGRHASRVHVVFPAVLLAMTSLSAAQDVQVSSFHGNGTLSWTNPTANGRYTVEWSPAAGGPWTNWDSLADRPLTNRSMSVAVPMFFRVAVATNGGKYVPPGGRVLLIVGQATNAIGEYVASNGVAPGGVIGYTSVYMTDGLTNAANAGGGTQHAQWLADHLPDSAVQLGLYMVGALDGVTNHEHDAVLDHLGAWIAGAARPVYLRIGYEFDYPGNAYEPAPYVAAWRYIVDRMRGQGVTNADFVWHSYASAAAHPVTDWYPGDDYVDWFAVSIFFQVFGTDTWYLANMADLARQHHKPLMIAESSPLTRGTTNGIVCWTSWFERVFAYIREEDVRAFSYINCNWDGPEYPQFNTLGWGDCRVESDPYVQERWLAEITNGVYWNAAPDLFQRLAEP